MPAIVRATWIFAFVAKLVFVCALAHGAETDAGVAAAVHWTQNPIERSARLRRLTWSRFVDVSDGADLSSGYVHSFDQDDQGFMWFGSRNGLDRYDG